MSKCGECEHCIKFDHDNGTLVYCQIESVSIQNTNERPDWCPLQEQERQGE